MRRARLVAAGEQLSGTEGQVRGTDPGDDGGAGLDVDDLELARALVAADPARSSTGRGGADALPPVVGAVVFDFDGVMTDNTALVVDVLDNSNSRIILPTPTGPIPSAQVVDYAKKLNSHQTAVVILENYTEAQIGDQFRDRGTPWFIGLRCLGYEHIVFLQGNGAGNPEGLVTLVKYD